MGRYSHVLHEILAMKASLRDVSYAHEIRVSKKEPHDLARYVLGSLAGHYVLLGKPPYGVCIPHLLI
jgi:hypothetical protein